MNTIEQAKKLFRTQVTSDLGQALAELRADHPGFTAEQLMSLLRQEWPALVFEAQLIEADQWEPPKVPVYRFTGSPKTKPAASLHDVLGLPAKIQARSKAQERELLLVEAADGEIVDIELVRSDHAEELHKKTQKLIDKTPGLHREIARHLALDQNPDLAGEYDDQDELQKNQLLIKDLGLAS